MTDISFEFGKNWKNFLGTLQEDRIKEAENSLLRALKRSTLKNSRFLDIGSGSGLFSLAARRLGAEVHSFDYDPFSVECTRHLKEKFAPQDEKWVVEQGSVLDKNYLSTLGQFDIVYSWGVLHHTGDMWASLNNILPLIAPKGLVYIAIYNDQGIISKGWKAIKKAYNYSPSFLKPLIFWPCALWLWKYRLIWGTLRYANPLKFLSTYHAGNRGMSIYYDAVDWIGGYPFEVAKPEEIFAFFAEQGFQLHFLKTCGGKLGCNEFVFHKER